MSRNIHVPVTLGEFTANLFASLVSSVKDWLDERQPAATPTIEDLSNDGVFDRVMDEVEDTEADIIMPMYFHHFCDLEDAVAESESRARHGIERARCAVEALVYDELCCLYFAKAGEIFDQWKNGQTVQVSDEWNGQGL